MRAPIILILTSIAGLLSCETQLPSKGIRPAIQHITDSIAANNELISEVVGLPATRTNQWDRYERLREEATDAELLLLTDHYNAVVRCYAFDAILYRGNTTDVFNALVKRLSDTETVKVSSGCISGWQKVGDYLVERVTPEVYYPPVYALSRGQKNIIDSILLFDKANTLTAKSKLLKELPPDKKYYHRVKELVTVEKNYDAVIALSKYRKQEDKILIETLLKSTGDELQYYGLSAVRFFPDSAFFPYIGSILHTEIEKSAKFNYRAIGALYSALVQYQDFPSRLLIEQALSEFRDYTPRDHLVAIQSALQKYPHPIYAGLLERIQLNEYQRELKRVN